MLGADDGIVSTASLAMGVAASNASSGATLVAGVATRDSPDLVLIGAGKTLYYKRRRVPSTEWTGFTVRLEPGQRWTTSNGRRATERQMTAVLGALTTLAIRGEHIEGVDTEGLDNVVLRGRR